MPTTKQKIGCIILAAGDSTRMNSEAKQLLEFRGKTLLRRAAETAIEANFDRIVIVLGSIAEELKKEIDDLPVQIAVNKNWETGMSSSIKVGLSAFSNGENIDAVVVTLCDQPLVSAKILRELGETFAETGKSIIACRYAETIGVPALFARVVFDDLMDLREDEGAKKVIKKYEAETAVILAPEAAFDVDTAQDYEKLKIIL
ncbi:MAG: nucleotidyltransferase family protein [Acidobacteriota bacterium]|nr:nucleotidyltransferase family protein [Acidobacteriota bacterium]